MRVPCLSSSIESVVVYRRGAEVTRVAELPAGSELPGEVRIDGLPLCLDDASVTVRIDGEGAPTATEVEVTLGATEPDEALPPPDDEALVAARREVLALQDRLQQTQRRREQLLEIPEVERPEGAEGQPPPAAPLRARRALLGFRQEQLEALDEDLSTQRVALREAVQQRDDLEQRVRSSARQTRPHELRKGARVALRWDTAAPAAPARLELRYHVPGARWAPSYSVGLDRELTRAELQLRAVVAQRTGEDWRGVRLALSTAAAQRWVDLPELHAVRIGRRQPAPPRTGWRPAPEGAAALYEDFDRTAPAPVPLSEPVFGAVDEGYDEFEELDDAVAAEEPWEPEAEMVMDLARDEPPMEKAKAKKADLAPPAPPAPQAAPAAAMAPRRRSVMPLASSVAGAVAGAASALFESNAHGAGGGPPGSPPEEPSALDAARDQLHYGALRMPGPRDPRRGSLVRFRLRERLVELIRIQEIEIDFDVLSVIEQAGRVAAEAGSAGLPPRHVAPAPWDGFDAVYEAEGAVEVDSDGEYHGVPLTMHSAPVACHHVVVPREATDVFRLAELHNPLSVPLLPGPAEVSVGGDYLLTAELPAAPPAGEVRLGLGVDQAVKVARNTSFEEESAGLIKGSLKLAHEIRIEVANRRAGPIELEVRERVPVLREKEEDIELSLGDVAPPWEAWEPDDESLKGGRRWRVTLDAGEERELRAAYTVKIAAKHELVGGNRREG